MSAKTTARLASGLLSRKGMAAPSAGPQMRENMVRSLDRPAIVPVGTPPLGRLTPDPVCGKLADRIAPEPAAQNRVRVSLRLDEDRHVRPIGTARCNPSSSRLSTNVSSGTPRICRTSRRICAGTRRSSRPTRRAKATRAASGARRADMGRHDPENWSATETAENDEAQQVPADTDTGSAAAGSLMSVQIRRARPPREHPPCGPAEVPEPATRAQDEARPAGEITTYWARLRGSRR